MFHSQKGRLALPLLALPLLASAAPKCRDLTLNVTANVDDGLKIEIPPLDLDDNPNVIIDLLDSVLGDVGDLYPVVPVGGTYDIVGTYCEPEESIPDRADTLQILVHGATYTKEYWTGHDLPPEQKEQYSYAHYASKEGYHTLSIDRLGSGESSRPNPLLEVQNNLEAEIMHELANLAKDGKIGDKKFSKLVLVGHSLGSFIGSIATQRHPADWDAIVLTGWSADLLLNFAQVPLGGLLPAAIGKAEEFSGVDLPYLVFTVHKVMRHVFFSKDGTFDPAIEERDWKRRNTISVGELVTLFHGIRPNPAFDRPVMALDGDNDALLCVAHHCKPGDDNSPGSSKSIFPSSSNFTYAIVPDSGHNINLHYSAKKGYKAAHEFINFNVK